MLCLEEQDLVWKEYYSKVYVPALLRARSGDHTGPGATK
jgi:hypothetical protein